MVEVWAWVILILILILIQIVLHPDRGGGLNPSGVLGGGTPTQVAVFWEKARGRGCVWAETVPALSLVRFPHPQPPSIRSKGAGGILTSSNGLQRLAADCFLPQLAPQLLQSTQAESDLIEIPPFFLPPGHTYLSTYLRASGLVGCRVLVLPPLDIYLTQGFGSSRRSRQHNSTLGPSLSSLGVGI